MKNSQKIGTFLLLLLAILTTACAGNSPEAAPVQEETPLIIASPTPEQMDLPTPIPRPTRNSAEVLTTWGNPGNLDVQHMHVESRCSECHHPPYVDKFTKAACPACHLTSPRVAPDDDVCLSCHGETRTGLTELTRDYAPVNPHDYHYGIDMRCDACHLMHEPVDALCDACHEDYKVSRSS